MASGDTLVVFTPLHNEPPASAYATLDLRDNRPVLDFDGASDEEAVFSAVLPRAYAGGGLTVVLHVAFATATSGTSRWQAAFERVAPNDLDIDGDNFTSFQSAGGSANGTSGKTVAVSVAFTDGSQIGSLQAGEAFRLKVHRDADGTSGTDDITTDAQLVAVEVKESQMARDFSKNLSNSMSLGVNKVNLLLAGAAKISVHARVNADAFDAGVSDNRILCIAFDNSNGSGLILAINGSGANKVIRVYARSKLEALSFRDGALNVTTGAWHSLGGVISFSGNTITPYLDGSADNGGGASFSATSYTPGTPTTVVDAIGANTAPPIQTNFEFDGRIAELAIWRDDIGADGFAMLAQGFSPLLVKPQSLAIYFPLRGIGGGAGPERDVRGGLSATINGTVAIADHPRVFVPAPQQAIVGAKGYWPPLRQTLTLPALSPGLIS